MDKWIEECAEEIVEGWFCITHDQTKSTLTVVHDIIARHFAAWENDNEADLTVVWMTATAKERDRQAELITRLTDKIDSQRMTIAALEQATYDAENQEIQTLPETVTKQRECIKKIANGCIVWQPANKTIEEQRERIESMVESGVEQAREAVQYRERIAELEAERERIAELEAEIEFRQNLQDAQPLTNEIIKGYVAWLERELAIATAKADPLKYLETYVLGIMKEDGDDTMG